jgi:hypothetical protein
MLNICIRNILTSPKKSDTILFKVIVYSGENPQGLVIFFKDVLHGIVLGSDKNG